MATQPQGEHGRDLLLRTADRSPKIWNVQPAPSVETRSGRAAAPRICASATTVVPSAAPSSARCAAMSLVEPVLDSQYIR